MQPIISITIPTYNRAYLLEKALEALCRQIDEDHLHDQVEIVVSDNCSTDRTEAITRNFISKGRYHIIYNRNAENIGVIKNILKLVELCTAKYWMFYGDDDIIGPGALRAMISGFQSEPRYPVFMYKLPDEADDYCRELTTDTVLSFEKLAGNYFYYVGNAGIFAVESSLAKKITEEYEATLIKTCWPQTMIIFLVMYCSEIKSAKFMNLVSSIPPMDVVIISNAYYLFETTIYALLRTSLFIEEAIGKGFTDIAVHSIYGIQHFDTVKETILEGYQFYDLPKQRQDFKASLKEAVKNIPPKYKREINYLNKYISGPPLVLYLRFYSLYAKKLIFKELNTGLMSKFKIISPLGFNAIMKHRIAERNEKRQNAKRMEVDSASGYF